MNLIEQFFIIGLFVQIAHSIEELAMGFHKKWYLFKMPFWFFLVFEIVFESFWIAVWLFIEPKVSDIKAAHLSGAGNVKKYVPGLVTAPIHMIVFLVFYLRFIF